ncbi:unnamed protein product, partial [Nesidiocoris tenuis]
LGEVLKDFKIPLHLDGARLFNSVVYYGRPVKDTVVPCDSINICLSKGLGTPMGSLLLGNEQFIEKARILRKVIGGGMRQVGLMAAAGIYALDHMIDRLREDHADARAIAQAIHDCGSQVISVDMDSVETNILLIHCDTRFVKTDEFCRRLAHLRFVRIRSKNFEIRKKYRFVRICLKNFFFEFFKNVLGKCGAGGWREAAEAEGPGDSGGARQSRLSLAIRQMTDAAADADGHSSRDAIAINSRK